MEKVTMDEFRSRLDEYKQSDDALRVAIAEFQGTIPDLPGRLKQIRKLAKRRDEAWSKWRAAWPEEPPSIAV